MQLTRKNPFENRFLLFGLVLLGLSVLIGSQIVMRAGTSTEHLSSTPPGPVWPVAHVSLERPEWRQNVPLETLVSESDAILIGNARSNSTRISDDWQQVTTDFEFVVSDVLDGDIQPDSIITIRMSGGLARRPEGHLVNVMTPGLTKMQNGRRFLVFLQALADRTYTTLRGSQGVYEVDQTTGRAHHLGSINRGDGVPMTPVLRQIHGILRDS